MTKSYQLTNFVQIGNIKKLFKTIEPPSKIVLKSFDESRSEERALPIYQQSHPKYLPLPT